MEIKISNKYKLVSQEHGYNLVENVTRHKVERGERGFNAKKTDETYESQTILAYNISMEYALKRLIHLNLHTKNIKTDLKEFLSLYREEKSKMEQLLNV